MLKLKSNFVVYEPLYYNSKNSSFNNVLWMKIKNYKFTVPFNFNMFWFKAFNLKYLIYNAFFENNSLKGLHKYLNEARGLYRPFKAKLKLIGLRYRILSIKKTNYVGTIINVGLSHLVFFNVTQMPIFIKRYKKKHSLIFYSLSKYSLLEVLFLIRRFRGPNVFTGNGIKLLREKLKYKPRTKTK